MSDWDEERITKIESALAGTAGGFTILVVFAIIFGFIWQSDNSTTTKRG